MNTFKVGDTVRCFQDFAYDAAGSVSIVGKIDQEFFNKYERFYVKEQPKVKENPKKSKGINQKIKEWEELSTTYYQDLTEIVYRFLKDDIGFIVNKIDDKYCFLSEHECLELPEKLPKNYNNTIFSDFWILKGTIEQFDIRKAEEDRIEKIRIQALDKLTDEEKDVLGLI